MSKVSAEHQASFNKTTFGFWVYLMTDSVLFAALFATFAVLRNNTADAESAQEIFDLGFVFLETIILLLSSLTSGMALLSARMAQRTATFVWLAVTFFLGFAFLGLEISEFAALAAEGNSWQASAFLSSYFTLVGTHGLHIAVGLLWLLTLVYLLRQRGITHSFVKRMAMFSLFWHFLDIIWIFIFTLVYLLGVSL